MPKPAGSGLGGSVSMPKPPGRGALCFDVHGQVSGAPTVVPGSPCSLPLVPRPWSLVPGPSSVPRVGGRHMACHRGPWDARSADLARWLVSWSLGREVGGPSSGLGVPASWSLGREVGGPGSVSGVLPWRLAIPGAGRMPPAGCRELGDGVFPRHPGSRLDVLSVPGNISPMSCPWPSRSPSGRRGVLTRNRTS